MTHRAPRGCALALLLLLSVGCGGTASETGSTAASATTGGATPSGAPVLFGLPGPSTGLDETRCRPERLLPGAAPWVPPAYTEEDLAALRARVLVDPPALLPGDPYTDAALVPADTSGVCAVLAASEVPGGYRLQTFADGVAAAAAGGTVTHTGACGACSSLQDLAVYLADPDLGEPVRRCALLSLGGDDRAAAECIMRLGFSAPCAQIWGFNSTHTRAACLDVCLAALDDPYHLADGALNPCLACDEEESGPVFKAVAGRIRRNSGIPVAICRPPEEVSIVEHRAYP